MTEKLQKPIQLWHLILSFVLTIVCTTGAVGVKYGTREAEFAQAQNDIKGLQEDSKEYRDFMRRTDVNVARIGERLGVKVEVAEAHK